MSEGKEDESEIIMDILVFLEELQGGDAMSELQAFEERCLKQFDECKDAEYSSKAVGVEVLESGKLCFG